ncbi:MAG: radical SAM protein [Clostridia bacterium]|nr:radical SAM protein [Clostridia bacterium]
MKKYFMNRKEDVKMVNDNFLFPSTVLVEPTNICNINCKMCEARCSVTKNIEKKFLTPEQLNTILRKLDKYIINVVFQGDCEPTMNPYLPDLCAVASKYTKQVGLVSNGTMLKDRYIKNLVDSGLTWFALSIDDHRPEKYEAIRVGASFKRVVENLQTLVKVRENGNGKLNIVTHKIVFPEDTIEDLEEYIHTFYVENRVNKITFAPLVEEGSTMVKNWIEMRNELENRLIRQNININLRDFANYPYRTMHKYCGTNLFFINHEGNFNCCGLHTRLNRKFGNLITEELEDIVQRENFLEYHKFWLERDYNNKIPTVCRNCYLLKSSYFTYCLDEGLDAADSFESKTSDVAS